MRICRRNAKRTDGGLRGVVRVGVLMVVTVSVGANVGVGGTSVFDDSETVNAEIGAVIAKGGAGGGIASSGA